MCGGGQFELQLRINIWRSAQSQVAIHSNRVHQTKAHKYFRSLIVRKKGEPQTDTLNSSQKNSTSHEEDLCLCGAMSVCRVLVLQFVPRGRHFV